MSISISPPLGTLLPGAESLEGGKSDPSHRSFCFQRGGTDPGGDLQLEQKWNSRNISFDLEIEDVKVRGNRSLLKEVWVNLIDNAIKFSPKNSIISISAYSNGKDMVFAIEDRGEGMDEATCDKIFDKFYQGDTSHATEGNGLGLSLVRKIVELHHGSIKVKSQPGRGSIFVVMLPLEG